MNKNNRILYPAIFHYEDGGYCVEFPDLKGCITEGDNYEEALRMANEAANEFIIFLEDDGQEVPKPSKKVIVENDDDIVNYIQVDTLKYREEVDELMKKRIKKTLTIPQYLNDLGVKRNLNFSQILADGLKRKLNL